MPRRGTRRVPTAGEYYVCMNPKYTDKRVLVRSVSQTHAEVNNQTNGRNTHVALDNFYEADAHLRSGYRHCP